VADLLAVKKATDDGDALDQALVAHLLAWPYVTGDSLIGGHARTKRRPKATRKHLRECRDGLADDRGVLALTGCVHDAEGQRGRS